MVAFLKGLNRLNFPRRVMIPQWDFNIFCVNICVYPFELLPLTEIEWLSLKTNFFDGHFFCKMRHELNVLSLAPQCLLCASEDSKVMLWPNTDFLPNILSSNYC